jgi:hypothetical protein
MGRGVSEGDAEPYRGFKAGPIIIKRMDRTEICHASQFVMAGHSRSEGRRRFRSPMPGYPSFLKEGFFED